MKNEELILGYQWSPETKKYIGEYKFPNNKDKDEIHLPPFTTLTKPPEVKKNFAAYWNGDKWFIDVNLDPISEHSRIDDHGVKDYLQLIRDARNKLLMQSDWTQLPDVRLSEEQKESWKIYRKQLRDLPENIEEPRLLMLDMNHPDWPVAPG